MREIIDRVTSALDIEEKDFFDNVLNDEYFDEYLVEATIDALYNVIESNLFTDAELAKLTITFENPGGFYLASDCIDHFELIIGLDDELEMEDIHFGVWH